MGATEANIIQAARDLEEPLVRYATRILGDRERARDVVQDAFLKLHQEAQAGSDVAERPRRWLFTVCRNGALDILRRQKRMCALDSVDAADQAVAARSFERRQVGEVVDLFERLPDKQRRVMEMRFGEDKSYRTIGEATGISTGHVGYLIHDGIRALRRHLGVASLLLLLGAGTFVLLTQREAAESTPSESRTPVVLPDHTAAVPNQPAVPTPAPAPMPSPPEAAPRPRVAMPMATSSAPPMSSAEATASARPAASAAPAASAEPAASSGQPATSSAPVPFIPPSTSSPGTSTGARRRFEAE